MHHMHHSPSCHCFRSPRWFTFSLLPSFHPPNHMPTHLTVVKRTSAKPLRLRGPQRQVRDGRRREKRAKRIHKAMCSDGTMETKAQTHDTTRHDTLFLPPPTPATWLTASIHTSHVVTPHMHTHPSSPSSPLTCCCLLQLMCPHPSPPPLPAKVSSAVPFPLLLHSHTQHNTHHAHTHLCLHSSSPTHSKCREETKATSSTHPFLFFIIFFFPAATTTTTTR